MKKILYVILGLIVLYIILACFGKSFVVIKREKTINKPADMVKARLADLKFFQEQWSPWTEKDPDMKKSYEGNPGEVGHKVSWESTVKEVGTGTMEIVSLAGDSVVMKLSFKGQGDTKGYFVASPKGEGTDVTWAIEMRPPFFARPIMMFMNMDKMLGDVFDQGLSKFKVLMESMPAESNAASYDVKELDWPETHFVGTKKETVTFANMNEYFMKNMSLVGQAMGKPGVKPESGIIGMFENFNQEKKQSEIAVMFRVPKGTKVSGLESYTYPAGKVYMVEYIGPYEKSMNAHMAIGSKLKPEEMRQWVAMEEYIVAPDKEKDSTKFVTNIYYVKK
jgi:hypothetical protein